MKGGPKKKLGTKKGLKQETKFTKKRSRLSDLTELDMEEFEGEEVQEEEMIVNKGTIEAQDRKKEDVQDPIGRNEEIDEGVM